MLAALLAGAAVTFHFAFVLPTAHCDCRCGHCFYEQGHSPRVEAADYLDALDEALDLLASRGLQQVIVSGGEPMLSPRLGALVELCAGKVMHVLLLTRGARLTVENLAWLEAIGVDDISLSADQVDPELKQLINRLIFHSRFQPTLLCCLTRANTGEVPALLELRQRLGVPLLFSTAYIPERSLDFDRLSLRAMDGIEREALFDLLAPWAEDHQTQPYLGLLRRFYRGEQVHPGSCAMGTSGLVIDADGSVYPCFHRRDLWAGNLLVHPWEQIEDRLRTVGRDLGGASCFGEHCLSMFAGLR